MILKAATKFNIGDTVYYLEGTTVKPFVINHITVCYYANEQHTDYFDKKFNMIREKNLHGSPQAVIDSITIEETK